jgi:hypothetical protein
MHSNLIWVAAIIWVAAYIKFSSEMYGILFTILAPGYAQNNTADNLQFPL